MRAAEEGKREEIPRENTVLTSCFLLARLRKEPERLVNAAIWGDLLVRVYETRVFLDEMGEGRIVGRYQAREGVFTASFSYLKAKKPFLMLAQALPAANRVLILTLEPSESISELESYFLPESKGRNSLSFAICTDLPAFPATSTIISLSFSLSSTSLLLASTSKLYLFTPSMVSSFRRLQPFKHKLVQTMQLYERLNYLFISAQEKRTGQGLVCVWDVNVCLPLLEVWVSVGSLIGSISVVPCLKLAGKVVILGLSADSDLIVMELIPVPIRLEFRSCCRLAPESQLIAERYEQIDQIYLLSSTSLTYFHKSCILPPANPSLWQAPVLSSALDTDLKAQLTACISTISAQGELGRLEEINRLLEEVQDPEYCPPSPSEQCSPRVAEGEGGDITGDRL